MSTARLLRRGKTWYVVVSYVDGDGRPRQRWRTTGTTDKARATEALRAERDAWRESMINWLRRTGYVVFGGKTPRGEPKFRLTDKGRAALPPRAGGVGHEA